MLTPSPFDADGLLQMTCERALTRWQQLNPDGPVGRWAFTIMSSVWKNELRSRAIRQGQGFVSLESRGRVVGKPRREYLLSTSVK